MLFGVAPNTVYELPNASRKWSRGLRDYGNRSKAEFDHISSDTLSLRSISRGFSAGVAPISTVFGREGRSSSLRSTRRARVCALVASNRTQDQGVDWGK